MLPDSRNSQTFISAEDSQYMVYSYMKWLGSSNVINSLQLPMKVIHVIRNPYDNIATSALNEKTRAL